MTELVPVSLVMTVLNESATIGRFLERLADQTCRPAQVVIVDGGSVDGTVATVEHAPVPAGVELKVVIVPGASISEGRNHAIELASYDDVLVTDGGVELDERWVELMAGALRDGDADVVSGFFEPGGATPQARRIASIITPLLSEIDPTTFLPSSRSLALTRRAWARVGGYPTWLDYCEDLVFDLAMRDDGARFVFVPDAIARWDARPTLRAYAKQYYRYARGDGKARLWGRRHAARYLAYAGGAAALVRFPRTALVVGGALGGAYLSRYVRRAWTRRTGGARDDVALLALVPVVVVAGDVAKMVGYPVGVLWRARHRRQPRPEPRG